jgi:ADP-ribose pyrophosphatase YjhB (NUDIX family)
MPLVRKVLPEDTRERLVCSACGTIHYQNPKVLVWCYAYWGKSLVLCRRALEPERGYWAPPAGFVEQGETLEEAAARELHEEVGLNIAPSRMALYKVVSVPHMSQIYVGFRTELLECPKFNIGPEALEARLFEESEFPLAELAYQYMADLGDPTQIYRYIHSGEFPITSTVLRRR